MNLSPNDSLLTKLISTIAYGVAALVTISLPATYFTTEYHDRFGSVTTLSRIYGLTATKVINNNPTTWRFEGHKLLILEENDAASNGAITNYSILDTKRDVIVKSSEKPLPWPVISHETSLYNSAAIVGYYKVEQSLRLLLIETLWWLLGSGVLGLMVAFSLKSLPLNVLQRSQQRLAYLAHHDVLTGLPNRALLNERLERSILQAERYGRCITAVFIDLDNFKYINDSLGHDIGDELLRQVANRMQHLINGTNMVARLGGDEFVIILFDESENAESAAASIERLRDKIAEPMRIGSHSLEVTLSMGIAIYPDDGKDVATLLKNADTAMYQAKDLGRNNLQFYTAEMNRKLQERMFLRNGLLRAMKEGEFFLVYQPQVDLRSKQVIGVEALIRWNHPEHGLIPPVQFIPLAEETGMIVKIGEWALNTACRQNKAWQAAGMDRIKMSVNVSPRQFGEKDFVECVRGVLEESGLEPQYLELEITESLLMENVETAVVKMKTLNAMGVQFSIDDFGTGYSSLSSLKHFPVARLKIDKSFVKGLPDDQDDSAIATAVIALAHRLKLRVVAEGVESDQQHIFLRNNECDEMQGYHFSKPVLAEEITRILTLSNEVTTKRVFSPSAMTSAFNSTSHAFGHERAL